MQKVEGSSPFSRFRKAPQMSRFSVLIPLEVDARDGNFLCPVAVSLPFRSGVGWVRPTR